MNPWLKKNPFLSMWLSSANRVVGAVRARATARAKRELKAAVAEATSLPLLKARPKRRR